jgi:hypothetical protein
MNTFEINLSKVLSHSMVWESSRLEVDNDIPLGYYRNGGSPAPGTQESMAEVMKAYRENLLPMIQQQVSAAKQYEPAMQDLREQISPREQQLNADLYAKYGPQFAKTGSDIARQNAQAQAETDLGIVSGTGRDLVREAMKTQKEADPEAYRARELALSNLEKLQGSLTDPNAGLSGAERAEIDRSLARENFARGTGATPTATSTVSNAMAFGGAGEARKQQRQSAIANAAQLATGAVQPLSSRIDTFQMTTGRPSINQGEARTGGAREVGQESNAMGMNMFGNASQMRQQENQINASRQSALDQFGGVMSGLNSAGSAYKNLGCCWTFAEAYYGWDNIPDEVRVLRDLEYSLQKREGYRRMSRWLVPMMKKSSIARELTNWFLIKPITSYAKYYVHGEGNGWVFKPLKDLYFATWEDMGARAGVPNDVMNLRLAAGVWNSGLYPL